MTARTRLLLVGAGHAHLEVVRRAGELLEAGYDVTLLAPASFDYSGSASASATGEAPRDAARIDVTALARRAGVRHHAGLLVALDLGAGAATADDGTVLRHDVVSLNLGSVVDEADLDVDGTVLRAKPLSQLRALAERLAAAPAGGLRVTVVGGGATGVELAAHLAVRPAVRAVTLLEGGTEVGADLPRGARRRAVRVLARRGVQVRTGCAVAALGRDGARLATGVVVPHDLAVLATGLVAAPLVADLGLGDGRGVPVGATLQHPEHATVHAVGDCAHFLPGPLPRVGVHGVRQAPVLVESLLARRRGAALPTYAPPRRTLAVLDLGGGDALAVRGRLWWHGAAALRLKRRIDARWLARYR